MTDHQETNIHPSAVVDPGAKLGAGVQIGAFAVVGPHVVLGDRVRIDHHGMVRGKTSLGAGTRVWSFATVGTEPQDLKYKGEDTELICGENNMIREYANISLGTVGGGGKTVVGSDNLFMVNTHIAHDCIVGNHCILANGVSLAGHIQVEDGAVIGGHTAIHQFVRIGRLAMLAGGSIVVQDVPPFVTVHGNHASPAGLNLLGLKRSGRSKDQIRNIKMMYKLLYQSGLTLEEAIERMGKDLPDSEDLECFKAFCQGTSRGLCR